MSANIDTVRAGLDAYKRGDLDSVGELLAPDVRWEGVDGGTCSTREETLEALRANSTRATDLELADAVPFGTDKVMVCLVRVGGDPGGDEDGQFRLYNVVTFAGEKIARMQGFVARKDAVQAARGGDADPAGKSKAKADKKRKRPLKRRIRMAVGRALGR